jgi:hypothetical protein
MKREDFSAVEHHVKNGILDVDDSRNPIDVLLQDDMGGADWLSVRLSNKEWRQWNLIFSSDAERMVWLQDNISELMFAKHKRQLRDAVKKMPYSEKNAARIEKWLRCLPKGEKQ